MGAGLLNATAIWSSVAQQCVTYVKSKAAMNTFKDQVSMQFLLWYIRHKQTDVDSACFPSLMVTVTCSSVVIDQLIYTGTF